MKTIPRIGVVIFFLWNQNSMLNANVSKCKRSFVKWLPNGMAGVSIHKILIPITHFTEHQHWPLFGIYFIRLAHIFCKTKAASETAICRYVCAKVSDTQNPLFHMFIFIGLQLWYFSFHHTSFEKSLHLNNILQ